MKRGRHWQPQYLVHDSTGAGEDWPGDGDVDADGDARWKPETTHIPDAERSGFVSSWQKAKENCIAQPSGLRSRQNQADAHQQLLFGPSIIANL